MTFVVDWIFILVQDLVRTVLVQHESLDLAATRVFVENLCQNAVDTKLVARCLTDGTDPSRIWGWTGHHDEILEIETLKMCAQESSCGIVQLFRGQGTGQWNFDNLTANGIRLWHFSILIFPRIVIDIKRLVQQLLRILTGGYKVLNDPFHRSIQLFLFYHVQPDQVILGLYSFDSSHWWVMELCDGYLVFSGMIIFEDWDWFVSAIF